MDDQTKELYGYWVKAIGTIVAAISSTPPVQWPTVVLDDLNATGNSIQAIGNGIAAGAEEPFSLEALGSEVSAIGNLEVVTALWISFPKDTKITLRIQGNLIQALGSLIAFGSEVEEAIPTKGQSLGMLGNLLQATGSFMIALGLKLRRSPATYSEGQSYGAWGSWILATGAILSAIRLQIDIGAGSDE